MPMITSFRSNVGNKWQDVVIPEICAKIYEKSASLSAEFNSLTKSKNGELSYADFVESMKKYPIYDENLPIEI